jgi:hypothetical protein
MAFYVLLLSGIIQLFGSLAYVRDTLTGESQPNRISFFFWSLAPGISTAAALSEGVKWAVLPVFLAGFFPFLVFVASFFNRKAYWKLGAFDWACGFLSLAALILWQITKNAGVAIFFAILSDAAAAIPTIRKSWVDPESETPTIYVTSNFSALASFFVVQEVSFAEIAFPIYLLLINAVILTAIYGGKFQKSRLTRLSAPEASS